MNKNSKSALSARNLWISFLWFPFLLPGILILNIDIIPAVSVFALFALNTASHYWRYRRQLKSKDHLETGAI
jgi:hypothetical protein